MDCAALKIMSDHQKHTEFLRECIRYDGSARRQELLNEIVRIQGDARCVWHAAWLMAMLAVLAVAALGYGTILVANFPYNAPQSVVDLIYAVGLGSLISLLVFAGLGMAYRSKLDRRREECRQIVTRLLESRLGSTVISPARDHRAGGGDGGTDRVVGDADDFLAKIEPAAQG
jgi:hypothetical protein